VLFGDGFLAVPSSELWRAAAGRQAQAIISTQATPRRDPRISAEYRKVTLYPPGQFLEQQKTRLDAGTVIIVDSMTQYQHPPG
jgi:xanthine dehydrogenase iron-sulfur cluster and FAD-binding subunit A